MDSTYSQRVTITEMPNGLEIKVHAARAWQDIVSGIGLLILIGALFNAAIDDQLVYQGVPYMAFVFLALAVSLFSFVRRVLWLVAGREVITIADGVLAIRRRAVLSADAHQSCTLAGVRNVSAKREPGFWSLGFNKRYIGRRGTIRFNCGGKNYRFGDMLEEYEADKIIARLREKKLIN